MMDLDCQDVSFIRFWIIQPNSHLKKSLKKFIFSPRCRQPSADHHHFAQKMPPEDIIHSGDIFISKKGVLLSPPEFWNTGHPGLRVFQEAPWALPQWQEPPMFLSKSSLSCHWHPRTPLLTPFSRKSLDVYSPLPLNWESPSAKEKVVIHPKGWVNSILCSSWEKIECWPHLKYEI